MNSHSFMQLVREKYSPKWIVILRIALGIALFAKGIQFIYDKTILTAVVEQSDVLVRYSWIEVVIPWIHLLGGLFIMIGLFTRLAALIQIPILLGAVYFINSDNSIFSDKTGWLFPVLLLAFLILFLIEGDGTISWRKYIRKENNIDTD